jgi:hypothetical protein
MKKRMMPFVVVVPLIATTSAVADTTRADYIAQADPICLTHTQGLNSALAGSSANVNHGKFKQAARKWRRANSIFTAGIDQLAALSPPAADSSLVATWLESLRAQVPIVKKVVRGLARGKLLVVLDRLVKLEDASTQTQDIVRDYGFQACNKY